MRIFMTGATGFIGSMLAKELVRRGHEVYGFTRKDEFYHNEPEGINTLLGDLLNRENIVKAVYASDPDIVIHLGALTPVRKSFRYPQQYAQVNYIGTVNLVETIKHHDIKQFIFASTSEVYYPWSINMQKEDDPLFGSTPYGISKVASDLYVQYAGLAYDLPYTILRPCNTFGRPNILPEEAREYLVEKAIIKMLTSKIVLFNGYPDVWRCWMYCSDHIDAYLRVFNDRRCMQEIFNVSPNNPTSVGELVSMIGELINYDGTVKWANDPRPYDPVYLCPDGSKLMSLGWRPKYTLKKGLKVTIDYWREVLGV